MTDGVYQGFPMYIYDLCWMVLEDMKYIYGVMPFEYMMLERGEMWYE